MKAIVLLGAPGAGKGTTAEGVREKTPYQHIATGDILRAALKTGTELGLKAKEYMERGELVPDEIIIQLVEQRLDAGNDDDAYMFDGFPRTLAQAQLLEQSLQQRNALLERVFFLDAPRNLLVERLTGRRICRSCGVNYHVTNLPPKKEGVCDQCGGELYRRADDEEATIANRLEVFTQQTEALISHYDDKGLLLRIDSAVDKYSLIDKLVEILT
jgi:adenylate kinase